MNTTTMDLNKLEMLTQREQLMEDIDLIVDCFDRDTESNDELVLRLCDAVIKNYPVENHV